MYEDSLDSPNDLGQIRLVGFGSLPQDAQQESKEMSRKHGSIMEITADRPMIASSDASMQRCAEVEATGKSFSIVWRNLSYGVSMGLHNRFLGKIGGLLIGGSSKRKDESNAHDNGTFDSIIGASSLDLVPGRLEAGRAKQSKGTQGRRMIFQDLNGYIKSGELTAILGPSGSGKTSLLSAICKGSLRDYEGAIDIIDGEVEISKNLISDEKRPPLHLSVIPQKDCLLDNLTVRENLVYASQLLNAAKKFDHETNILRVVEMLNLFDCIDSRVANISGGEHKRVSIAQELLRQPDVLVLDEPTSGLDSLSCERLIKSLKQLVKNSITERGKPIAIVMTIHQPDIDKFNMFDHVYCLSSGGGRVIFDGHPKDAMHVIKSVARLSENRVSDEGSSTDLDRVNAANLLIKIAARDTFGMEPIERLSAYQRKQFQGSLINAKFKAGCDEDLSSSLRRDKRLGAKRNDGGKFWTNTGILMRRDFLATLRDPLITKLVFGFHIILPFSMAMIYPANQHHACPVIEREFDLSSFSESKITKQIDDSLDELKCATETYLMLFIVIFSLSIISVTTAALSFPLRMHLILKERRNGWYDLKSFVLARQIAGLPFDIIFPSVTMMLTYKLLQMPPSTYEWRMFAILITTALVVMVSNTTGYIVGAFCMDSPEASTFLAVASTLPPSLLNGVSIRISRLPRIFANISWLSHFRLSNDLIFNIRYGFGVCYCDEKLDKLLRESKPRITGVPDVVLSTFKFYLGENGFGDGSMTSNSSIAENSTEADPFSEMALMASNAVSSGHHIGSCKDFRSQTFKFFEKLDESWCPILFGIFIGLVVFYKLILFVIVKYQITRRL